MAYKVAIDSSNSSENKNGIVEKDFTFTIAKYINERLNNIGIENFLVDENNTGLTDEEKVNIIKDKYGNGNNIIVISNRLNKGGKNGAEIMYPLRNNSKLASLIASNLEDAGQTVLKYYQLRNNSDTSKDDDYLIRNTANNLTIVIDYGYIDNTSDANFLKNNYEKLAEAVVKSIANYAGVSYSPANMEGYYIVKKGDSLWSIASKNNTTVDNIKKLNNLSSNNLSVGQVLKLSYDTENEDIKESNIYTVKKGDSLWLIANKYGTTVDELKSANNLKSNTLSIGQTLIIPEKKENTNKISYVVKKGDSLWLIANKYDTTVEKIKSTNNLKSNTLSIGQVLVIPSSSEFITYTVKKGDTIFMGNNGYKLYELSFFKRNNYDIIYLS